ncbi:hypothetical protein QUF54_08770 [Candidatus Marithioploca araucensis]|uniref:Uncharacterized protein n=1 Tax=Candidatus Marithioploca araucensis TaxID=70273 RepID=A0ABT7VV58_9GAMM|nr:hypothetical protein [Candidatus Marithioploca araucensis]
MESKAEALAFSGVQRFSFGFGVQSFSFGRILESNALALDSYNCSLGMRIQ